MNVDHIKMLFDLGELNSLFTNTINIETFLQKIVILVAKHMHVDVCSIYLFEESNNELILKATKGLNSELIDKVKLKIGEGIIGTVLKKMRPISEVKSKKNPHFKYIPGLQEEDYQSILAVPISQGNYKIGVLAVQRKKENPFDKTDKLALLTTSTQLASMLANAKAFTTSLSSLKDNTTKIAITELKMLKGKVASEGYSYSAIKIINNKNNYLRNNNRNFINNYSLDDFKQALITTEQQLEELQKKVEKKLSDAASLIFAAHLLMLKDNNLIKGIENLIKDKNTNPPNAIIKIFSEYRNIFLKSSEVIIQEKVQDLDDLATRIIDNLLAHDDQSEKYENHIIIIKDIFPSDLLKLSAENISGLIMVGGGVTSHISILARSLQIPMIIVDNIDLLYIPESTKILMDAHLGNIYINPTADIINTFEERNKAQKNLIENSEQLLQPAITIDKQRINILANINLLTDLNAIDKNIIDGIGLYRTEFPFLIRNDFPSEEEQFIIYKKLIQSLPEKPITFRTLDIGGDKVLSYYDKIKEENPFLGMRSIRFSLTHLEIFKQQIRAILRASADSNVKIMFPMISSLDDFFTCKEIVQECQKKLASENIDYNSNPKIGIMIELPSLLLIIDDLAKEVDFFSIGTNDLVQYILAVDRTNEKVAHLYQPYHPAVLRSLKAIADSAIKNKLEITICGDIAGTKEYIPFLLGIGIRNFSIGTTFIPKIKTLIAQLTIQNCKKIAKELLAQTEIKKTEVIIKNLK